MNDTDNPFYSRILSAKHLDEIYALLNSNYVEDSRATCRLTYSKDYLYWYLKYVPKNLIIGLVYKDERGKSKLVGFVTAMYIDVVINNVHKHLPYISLLCVHKEFRGYELNKILVNSLKKNIFLQNMSPPTLDQPISVKKNNEVAFFSERCFEDHAHSVTLECYSIPINFKKMREIQFLPEDEAPELPDAPSINTLHLLRENDLPEVTTKLNTYLRKYPIKMFFTAESTKHFLMPKKDIVYSFVNKNASGAVTDFVSIYKNYYFCIKKKKMLSVGALAYYFYESMTLDDLIALLIGKMTEYQIDQLVFYNNFDNMTISCTKYMTDTHLKFYFIGDPIHTTPDKNVYLSDLSLKANNHAIFPY